MTPRAKKHLVVATALRDVGLELVPVPTTTTEGSTDVHQP